MGKSAKVSKLAGQKEKAEIWIRKEVYGQAPEEHHFIISNGEKLEDLKDLVQSLEKMPEEVFRHYVNETKNDFSTWIKDVFKENSLAEELKKFNTKIEAELALQKHINNKLDKLVRKLVEKK